MSLEDTLGDILRKARQATNVSTEAAAQAAAVPVPEYVLVENSGMLPPKLNLIALATLLDLHPQKLERLASGWLPSVPDLSLWRELRQVTTAGPSYSVHCYLIWDEVTREAALFDTGFDAAPVFELIDKNQLQLKHLFITHTHEDHVAALASIRGKFPKVKLHSNSKHAPVDQRNRANDFIHLGSLRITNRDTPGHAEDGVTYIVGNFPEDAPSAAIVGDAIFAGSMGGAMAQAALAKQKIRDQIFSLPPETLICPGHGPLTTVAQEKANNPFFTLD
ncbi:MAG: MBL fold metallo-hydrolase [Verrucomicrobiales bacterium]|nr:MBL fold metallo-hydrolase [Verrucomicrobiales bacterium]